MAGFGPELLDEIRSRLDIVEIVGQHVNLKKAGQHWKGLCPFHAEKTPSFTVNPKRGIFHCFGCGAGGDAFGFLMRHDRMAFPEAVRALAQRAGVDLPSAPAPTAETEGKLEGLRRVMALAADLYVRALWAPDGARAREYLDRRGVDHEVARRFGMGYAPEGWNFLLGAMAQHGIGADQLVAAGLALPRQTGSGFYDRFRGRLLFTIRDVQGRPIAFGGRALAGEEPKYLNSPETPLYVKGQTLYALDLARPAMRDRRRAIIVEGYLDCVIAHQYGFDETVAALGTAFTPSQLGLLRRHADEIVALFDADAAGEKASSRLEEMLTEPAGLQSLGWSVSRTGGFEATGHVSLKVAALPQGHDPDSLLRAEGAAALTARLDAARPLLSVVLERALTQEELSTARGRATAHARVALLLSKVSSAEEATSLAREAARRLGVDATQLWIEAQQLQGARARNRPPESAAARAASASAWPQPKWAERDLLALLLHVDDARAELLTLLEEEYISHPGLRGLLAALRQAPLAAPESLLPMLASDAERELMAALLVLEQDWTDAEKMISTERERYDIWRRRQRVRQASQEVVRALGHDVQTVPEPEMHTLQQEALAIHELVINRPPPTGPSAAR